MNNQQSQSHQPNISKQPQPGFPPEMPRKPNLHTWASILIITVAAIIVVGLVSYGAYRYFTPQSEPGELPSTGEEETVDEFADWQTYRNEEYGFDMKYPGDWRYHTDDETGMITFYYREWRGEGDILLKTLEGSLEDEYQKMKQIWDSRDKCLLEKCSVEQFYETPNECKGKCKLSELTILVADKEGKVIKIENNPLGFSKEIFIERRKDEKPRWFLQFTSVFEHEAILDQILSTFKFIESESAVSYKTYQGDFFEVNYSSAIWTKDNCKYQLCSVEFGDEQCVISAGLWRNRPWNPINITTWEIGEYSPQVKEWAYGGGYISEIEVIFDIENIGTRSFNLFISSPDLYEKCRDNFRELLSTIRFIE